MSKEKVGCKSKRFQCLLKTYLVEECMHEATPPIHNDSDIIVPKIIIIIGILRLLIKVDIPVSYTHLKVKT